MVSPAVYINRRETLRTEWRVGVLVRRFCDIKTARWPGDVVILGRDVLITNSHLFVPDERVTYLRYFTQLAVLLFIFCHFLLSVLNLARTFNLIPRALVGTYWHKTVGDGEQVSQKPRYHSV